MTLVSAAGALSFQQDSPEISLLGPMIVLLFLLVEMVYMSHEAMLIQRSNFLEGVIDHVRRVPEDASAVDYKFGFGHVIADHQFRLREVWGLIRHREHIAWFYGGVGVATAVIAAFGLLRR